MGRNISADNYPLQGSRRQLRLTVRQNYQLVSSKCKPWSIIIHSPYELPSSYGEIETCSFNHLHDLEIIVTPEVIRTDESLRDVHPLKRNCYFDGEKTLRFFKIYTRRNCELECFAVFFLRIETMRCVPFFLVRDDNMTVCDHRDEKRYLYHRFRFLEDQDNVRGRCGCLDRCDHVSYNFEVFGRYFGGEFDSYKNIREDVSVTVKLKDDQVIPMRRYLKQTFVEFLAQSGGMLGLFAGISALSVIEVAYFFTLRLFSNVLRFVCFKKK